MLCQLTEARWDRVLIDLCVFTVFLVWMLRVVIQAKYYFLMWGEKSWEHTVVEKNYVICWLNFIFILKKTTKNLFEFGEWLLESNTLWWTCNSILLSYNLFPKSPSLVPSLVPHVLSLVRNCLGKTCLSIEYSTVSEESVWNKGSQTKFKLFCRVIFSETFHMGLKYLLQSTCLEKQWLFNSLIN